MTYRRLNFAMLAALIAPAALFAQAGDTTQVRPVADTQIAAPRPFGSVDGTKLKPGKWSYSVRIVQGDLSQEVGLRTLTISESRYAETDAWLIVDQTQMAGMTLTDSLYVSRRRLRPLHRTLAMGPASMTNAFSSDSITGSMSTPDGTIPIAMLHPQGIMASGGMLETVISLLPLAPNWKGSAELLTLGPDGAEAAPFVLEVTGVDSVDVPGGRREAWVATLSSGGTSQRLWIGRNGQKVLKSSTSGEGMGGAAVEAVLLPEPKG